jgi:separase
LTEFHGSASGIVSHDDWHLFLILDKTVQPFPWESLAVLKNRSVSRLPSLSFLRDRLELAPHWSSRSGAEAGATSDFVADASRAFYVLNPSGDLAKTQGEFEGWLSDMGRVGWSGVVGRKPMELEVEQALGSKDLFL